MNTLLKLYVLWVIAGLITFGLTVAYINATEGYIGTLVELAYDLAFAVIPFPIDLLAIWLIDPFSLVFQGIIFSLLLLLWLWLRSRETDY